MSSPVFQKRELAKRSFWQSLIGGNPKENALAEINNLLAEKTLLEISIEDIARIEERYDVDISKSMQEQAQTWFTQYLEFCLKDKLISETEEKEIRHLGYLLDIPSDVLSQIYHEHAGKIYKEGVASVLQDERYTDEEHLWLERLQESLRMEKEIAEDMHKKMRFDVFTTGANRLLADNKLSPEEDKEFERLADALQITPTFDDKSLANLERFRATWAIEHGILPEIKSNLILPKTEKCHLQLENADWHEVRTVRERIGYAGVSTRFKVMKGVYLNAGGYKPMSYSRDEVQLIDSGTLYLTSKRIILTGQKKNYTIRLSGIISVTPYSDGIEIGKQSGRSPMIIIPTGAEIFAMALQRLLGGDLDDTQEDEEIQKI